MILLAGSISGRPYLATFLAILPLSLVSATLAILFPVFLLIYALLPGLGAALSKQGKTLYSMAIFILYPVVFSIFLIYIALIEPGQSSQAFITLITIWLSALFLGKSLANNNPVQEVLQGLIFLEILITIRSTNSQIHQQLSRRPQHNARLSPRSRRRSTRTSTMV